MYLLLDAFQAAFTESPSLSLDAMQQFILYCAGQTNQQSLAIVLLSFYLSQFGERETMPSFLVRIMEVEALLSSSDSIIVHCLPYIKGKLSSFFVDALLTSLIGCFQNCSHMYQMARIVSSFFKGRFIPITTRTLLLAITLGFRAMTADPCIADMCLAIIQMVVATLARCDLMLDDRISRGIRCIISGLEGELEMEGEGWEGVDVREPLDEVEGKEWSVMSLMDNIEAIPVMPSSPEILLFLYSSHPKVIEAAMQRLESVTLSPFQKMEVFL